MEEEEEVSVPHWSGTTCGQFLPPVLHGSGDSAWARNLGVPLSDQRLLCGVDR